MILQSLYDYYQRKASDPESNIAPPGFEWKELPFIVVINERGDFIQFEDTREQKGNKMIANKFLVPQSPGKRTRNIRANFLWDTPEFIFGINNSLQKRENFLQTIKTKLPEDHMVVAAIVTFLRSVNYEQIETDPLWEEIKKVKPFMTFRIAGHKGCVIDEIRDLLTLQSEPQMMEDGICLITGNPAEIENLHTPLKGVVGANTTGAYIVSFNQSAFRSFGREQGNNAPVSKNAAFAYTTALNTLMGRDSENRFILAGNTVVFWAEKQVEFERQFRFFFTNPSKDDPDRNLREIKALFESIHSGKVYQEGETSFYILGLAPNAARISIRFWKRGKVAEFARKIAMNFEDLEIIRSKNDEREYFTLFNLLSHVAFDYKLDNLPPKLSGDLINSILEGTPYPATLQQQCIRRIRAEQHIDRIRAAILKAYLNRKNKYNNNIKTITMALDSENTNQAYLCGRLFAVLEKIQEEAHPGLNATIKDRFYGAASTTPVTVFGRLLTLKNHHVDKLKPGLKFYREKLIQEIMASISPKGLPSHLSLDDQSRFAIGYYHQRQDFFITKENINE